MDFISMWILFLIDFISYDQNMVKKNGKNIGKKYAEFQFDVQLVQFASGTFQTVTCLMLLLTSRPSCFSSLLCTFLRVGLTLFNFIFIL